MDALIPCLLSPSRNAASGSAHSESVLRQAEVRVVQKVKKQIERSSCKSELAVSLAGASVIASTF